MKQQELSPWGCPKRDCSSKSFVRKGFYLRECDSKKVQRYLCRNCKSTFSTQTFSDNYRHSVVREVPLLRRFLMSGSSQRRIARNLQINRKTVARRIDLLAARAKVALQKYFENRTPFSALQFDEMESFEVTKCKPVSIPLIVTPEREIVAIGVARMPAKGTFARISRDKYGKRVDERRAIISSLLADVGSRSVERCFVLTDQNPSYPGYLSAHFATVNHATTPGGRSSTTGYGELKRKGFDTMFALNHTAAMLRDGLATLKRRTWTTAKKAENLQKLLIIYQWYHNDELLCQTSRAREINARL